MERCVVFKCKGSELRQKGYRKFRSMFTLKIFNILNYGRNKAVIIENY